MQAWYVLQTKPCKEKDVSQLLTLGGFEVFNPQIKEVCYRAGTSFFKTSPLFPNYIFLHADLNDKNNFHLVKYTRGLNKIICAGHTPIALSNEIIETIQHRTTSEGLITKQVGLKTGDKIRVKKGPLKELIGILQKPASADGRVQVLLKLINYEMQAKLHWTEVERSQ